MAVIALTMAIGTASMMHMIVSEEVEQSSNNRGSWHVPVWPAVLSGGTVAGIVVLAFRRWWPDPYSTTSSDQRSESDEAP